MSKRIESPANPHAGLSDERIDELGRRMKAARALANMPNRSRYDVELAAEEAGVHASTLYRDIGRLQGRGTIEDIAPRGKGWPAGRSKLHPRQDELIDQFLRRDYLTQAKRSLTSVWKRVGDACEAEDLSRPARAAVIRRRDRISRREVAAKREGAKAAEKHTPRPGRYEVKRPWDVWQIDHTLADVIVVDRERRPIGRPWLTVVIDVCTRMIAGFYVGLEPPSTIRVATTLDLAVAPKGPWLRRHGYDYDCPVEGLMKLLHSDRAKEFTTPVLVRALKNQGVETFLRPPGRTRFGGHIERLIGTLMGTCRLLPGATHHSPTARGDYDSKASARLTLDQLQDYFAHQILGVYHHQVHSELGVSPIDAWRAATVNMAPEHPEDADAFRLDLLPELPRTIGRQGIQAFNELYYCQEIGEAFISGTREIKAKYDPRDLSQLHVQVRGRGYVTVPLSRVREGAPLTLWLYKASRRMAGEVGKARPHRETLQRAAAQAERIIQEAAGRSTQAARQLERLERARATAGHWVGRSAPAQPDRDDDDWGGAFGGGE
jgi:putative transposase